MSEPSKAAMDAAREIQLRGMGDGISERESAQIIDKALSKERNDFISVISPFANLGGDYDMPAYHDCEDDVVVMKCHDNYITAGWVRAAREFLIKIRGRK